MRKLRVRGFTYRDSFEGFQLLQERRWWGWKTIDREEVPGWANINRSFLGESGFVSKFTSYGRFGSDGVIEQ